MQDLHTPTVPSGPTSSTHHSALASNGSSSLLELMSEKERLESELSALSSVLDSHGVNMFTSLTTFDGYPRDDIDVAQIRTTRARIIHLQNDYKGLMSRIEAGLHAHHAATALQASSAIEGKDTTANTGGQNMRPVGIPFAKVNNVVLGSPADAAGLKAGDQITQFGSIDWANHEKLSKIAEVVQRSEGRSIVVNIIRPDVGGATSEEMRLILVPRRDWGGRGLLGCHLLPAA